MVKAKITKKYSGPSHLWQMRRIKEEEQLKKEYGYKNKKEVWKMMSILRNFRAQARRLIPLTDKQANLERKQLLDRLVKLGMIKVGAQVEDVLALSIRDVLGRRLQSLVVKKGMARSVKQARQFITHGHVVVGDKKIKSPSHLVTIQEEPVIQFSASSELASELHPERVTPANAKKRELTVEEKNKEAEKLALGEAHE